MSTALVPFDFHGDTIECIPEGSALWVGVTTVCGGIGVDDKNQREKLAAKSWALTQMVRTTTADGRGREVFCIDLESLPMWLATIDERRVPKDVRPKLVRYQKECKRALAEHFFGRPLGGDQEALARRAADLAVQGMAAEMAQLRREHDALAQQVLGVRRAAVDGAEQTRAAVIESGEMADHQAQGRHNQLGEGLHRLAVNLSAQGQEQTADILGALDEHGMSLSVIKADTHDTMSVVTALRQLLEGRSDQVPAIETALARALERGLAPLGQPQPAEPKDLPRVLTLAQAAAALGVMPHTIYTRLARENVSKKKRKKERRLHACLIPTARKRGRGVELLFDRDALIAYGVELMGPAAVGEPVQLPLVPRGTGQREQARALVRAILHRMTADMLAREPAKGNA